MLMSRGVLVPTAATVLSLLVATEAYKVLVFFPFDGKSHGILGEGYVKELLKKGHEVTYLTPFPIEERPNMTQIQLGKMTDTYPLSKMYIKLKKKIQVLDTYATYFKDATYTKDFILASAIANMDEAFNELVIQRVKTYMNISKLLNNEMPSMIGTTILSLFVFHKMSKVPLEDENFQKFIADPNQRFDVVVAEWVFSDMYSGLGALFQCPLVWSSSMDIHFHLQRLLDEPPNPAYHPDIHSNNVPPFSFVQRAIELLTLLNRVIANAVWLQSAEAAKYADAFGTAAFARGVTLPEYSDVIYNSSLLLLNAHASLGAAPKLPQNVKAVGGYHINREIEPLPQELQKLMDESKDGVVYFSMGSMMKTTDMPEQMKKELLKVFGALKQTVLWKFEVQVPNLPKNVHIQSWMPQQSILAHPNMKIFITHGGLLSSTETIHFGVPIIGVPLLGDQFLNMERSVAKGFAYQVKLSMNLANDLDFAITEVLQNPRYAETAKRLSSIYHDRPMLPGDELVYWIEHVVRTGGAAHLRSAALLVPWYQKLYLDLLVVLIGGVLLLSVLVTRLRRVWKSRRVEPKEKRS